MSKSNPLPASPTTPSTSRDLTAKTPQSLSAGRPEVKVDPGPSPKTHETRPLPTFIPVMPPPLKPTLPAAPTDEDLRHAMILKVAAEALEEHGLCKREKVLAKDGSGKVTSIRLVFDPAIWTEQLELLEKL